MGLKEKDIKNYIKKAQERLAKEKTTAEGQSGLPVSKDAEKGLLKIAKSTGRTKVEGMVLSSGPISATPLKMILGVDSGVQKEVSGAEKVNEGPSNPGKRPMIEPSSPPKKKLKSSEGEVSWMELLQDYEGEDEIVSLWDRRFPLKHFVREHITTVDDGDRIRGLGVEQACLALQSFALKSAALGHVVCDEFSKLRSRERQGRKEADAAKKAIAEHTALLSEIQTLKSKLAEQETLFAEKEEFVRKQLADTEAQWKAKIEEVRSTLKSHEDKISSQNSSIVELRASLDKAQSDLEALRTAKDAEIEELNIENAVALLKGFGKAKDQILALYPALNVSELDPLKEIVDGKLVLVSSPEEMDTELKEDTAAV